MDDITVEFKQDYAVIHTISTDGTRQEKIVDNVALKNALMTMETSSVETTPLLPGEYGTQRIISRGGRTKILYLEPPSIRRVTYHTRRRPEYRPGYFRDDEWDVRDQEAEESDEEYDVYLRERFDAHHDRYFNRHNRYKHYFNIVVPRLLWVLEVQENRGELDIFSSQVYAMKQSVYTGHEQLYRAPLGNVFGGNGICWGNNTLRLPSIKAIQGVPVLFFNSPFNDDLNSGHINDSEHFSGFYQMCHYVSNELAEGRDKEELLQEIENLLIQEPLTFNNLTS